MLVSGVVHCPDISEESGVLLSDFLLSLALHLRLLESAHLRREADLLRRCLLANRWPRPPYLLKHHDLLLVKVEQSNIVLGA